MSSERLGAQNMRMLIRYVQPRQHLWNPEDNNYKDKLMAAQAWSEIANEMQIPVPVVKSKWKNLRDMFHRERRKVQGPLTSPADYKGHWSHFKNLWFLLNPLETQYLEDIDQNYYDEDDNKAYIIKVDAEYSNQNDALSDRLRDDDEFDDYDRKAKKMKVSEDDEENDYDIMFLKSLAPYMRSLSPVRKLQVRNQIQEIFIEHIRK